MRRFKRNFSDVAALLPQITLLERSRHCARNSARLLYVDELRFVEPEARSRRQPSLSKSFPQASPVESTLRPREIAPSKVARLLLTAAAFAGGNNDSAGVGGSPEGAPGFSPFSVRAWGFGFKFHRGPRSPTSCTKFVGTGPRPSMPLRESDSHWRSMFRACSILRLRRLVRPGAC